MGWALDGLPSTKSSHKKERPVYRTASSHSRRRRLSRCETRKRENAKSSYTTGIWNIYQHTFRTRAKSSRKTMDTRVKESQYYIPIRCKVLIKTFSKSSNRKTGQTGLFVTRCAELKRPRPLNLHNYCNHAQVLRHVEGITCCALQCSVWIIGIYVQITR